MSSWLCELFMSVTKIYADVINGILTPEQSSDVLDPKLTWSFIVVYGSFM